MKDKLKVAFVVQRYGLEVNGGAELHCRQLAERMSKYYDIDVLTTCAVDYITWANYYPEKVEYINGITVRRFKVDTERNIDEFNQFYGKICATEHTYIDEVQWLWKQGPVCKGLINYINQNKDSYDIFIFMTYLYFTTYFGLQQVPEKSVFIPTAHDEPPIYFQIYRPLFHLPRGIFYNTNEEKEFVNKLFNNSYIKSDIGGVGIDTPRSEELPNIVEKYHIDYKYIVYVGRIDPAKGCDILFDYFTRYKSKKRTNLKLVLIGKPVMDIPKHEDIVSLGFLSDEDKFSWIASAEALVSPSKFESLSMVVLESMAMKTPVLVNGHCDVLKGHCLRSNGGLYFKDYNQFEKCLDLLLSDSILRERLGQNGEKYVKQNYRWSIIEHKLISLIENIISN